MVTWSASPAASDDPDRPPTIFGYVELAEGPWLEALLVDATLATLTEAMPMRATFIRRAGDGEHIPAVRPA